MHGIEHVMLYFIILLHIILYMCIFYVLYYKFQCLGFQVLRENVTQVAVFCVRHPLEPNSAILNLEVAVSSEA
jgi:hypothetical protein